MRNLSKFAILQLLRAYKWAVSPMFPPSCRYVPTCSEYAMEAVEHYGALRGSGMAVIRLLRCHPFARGGYDPVAPPHHHENAPRTIHQLATGSASPLAQTHLRNS